MNVTRQVSKGVLCKFLASCPYTIYTCPPRCRSTINMLRVNNSHAFANIVTVSWIDASEDETYHLLSTSLAAGGLINIVDNNHVTLEEGDRLVVSILSDGEINVVCSAEEMFIPLGG